VRELIGDAAGRLHTARSRNDQVATDFRLYIRDACDHVRDQITALMRAFAEQAERHAEVRRSAIRTPRSWRAPSPAG